MESNEEACISSSRTLKDHKLQHLQEVKDAFEHVDMLGDFGILPPPEHHQIEDIKNIKKLKILYDKSLYFSDVTLDVEGRQLTLSSFHFTAENLDQSVNKKSMEFLATNDVNEAVDLYRYNLLGAFTTALKYSMQPKYVPREYYSMCQLNSYPASGLEEYEYVLVQILSTFCKDNKKEFLVYSKSKNIIMKWEQLSLIKYFWCECDKPVDIAKLVELRMDWFKKHSWIYDSRRGISRDTHHPEDLSIKKVNNGKESDHTFLLWSPILGLPVHSLNEKLILDGKPYKSRHMIDKDKKKMEDDC